MMELKLDGDDGDTVRVSASGRITQAELPSSGDLMTQLAGGDVYARKLLLNLERADFLDSSGVGWLLVCHKRCREAGGLLVVHSVPPLIHKTLLVLRMNLVLNLADDAGGAAEAAEKHNAKEA